MVEKPLKVKENQKAYFSIMKKSAMKISVASVK
ncbi:hypothetical protein MNBD_NITROSPINAE04-1100 [hydrothermal vent metagenome]|uniref:Uncharacterized protein n=1 Tax=hydrothermal vent metagenome TaxID=652676 RepID=A0A3B1C8L4_9ZZZZ